MMSPVIKLFCLMVLFVTISCNTSPRKSNTKVIEDIYKPIHSVKAISDDLELAFSHNGTVSIEDVFTEWQRTVKSNSPDFINQNEFIKAIFDVFDSFYRPDNLSEMGNWACSDEINLNCKYVVIQNKIIYSVVNSKNINEFDQSIATKYLINNFRPPVDFGNALYLTDEYEESINIFLEKELINGSYTSSKNPLLKKKKNERIEALNNYIPVLRDYWGHNWQLVTYPLINLIIFNKSITKARIEFYVGYQSGLARMEKKGNRWIVKKSEISL